MYTQDELIEMTAGYRSIPIHTYAGYSGPWLENVYFQHFLRSRQDRSEMLYLPVFWTDLWCHLLQVQNSGQNEELLRQVDEFKTWATDLFNKLQRSGQRYYTVIQHDHGRYMYEFIGVKMPECVRVYSQTGAGNVVLPLLKDMFLLSYKQPEKKFLISFCGSPSTDLELGIRSQMDSICRKHFGKSYINYQGDQWAAVMAASTFSLCPRGCANTSFRLYESFHLGSIPIYIYTGEPVLPYREIIPWTECCILIKREELSELPKIINSLSAAKIKYMLELIKIYRMFFTYKFACLYIDKTC